MTPNEAKTAQQWAGMSGAAAFDFVAMHPGSWDDAVLMLEAWRDAAVAADRDRCANLCKRPPGWLTADQERLLKEVQAAIRGGA